MFCTGSFRCLGLCPQKKPPLSTLAAANQPLPARIWLFSLLYDLNESIIVQGFMTLFIELGRLPVAFHLLRHRALEMLHPSLAL
jgi:hypothetical protein